ncbi:MAG: family 43 glycosylhydrolase [Clostridia bacterium]|nr:family 43 glycosylhydrolase [Clostridia bacterium]
MKNQDINIRDPFIICKNQKYYMYGTRGNNFGQGTGGFDVYIGTDLENWSDPVQVFDSEKYSMNKSANWAPEVHEFNGKYYMFATFQQENGMRGTYSLVSDTPEGEFVPCSKGALTPSEWWSLDGTLYVSKDNIPYLVFCHEHVQILNGTICFIRLNEELSEAVGEPQYLFSGSDAYGAENIEGERYVTDGPFMYRGKNDRLYMIWSSIVNSQYYQCIAVSDNGEIDGKWIQLEPIFTKDGGHGMVFCDYNGKLRLTLHCPNEQPKERPAFFQLEDTGTTLRIK